MKNLKHRKIRLAIAQLLRTPAIIKTNMQQRFKRWHSLHFGTRNEAFAHKVAGYPIAAILPRPGVGSLARCQLNQGGRY